MNNINDAIFHLKNILKKHDLHLSKRHASKKMLSQYCLRTHRTCGFIQIVWLKLKFLVIFWKKNYIVASVHQQRKKKPKCSAIIYVFCKLNRLIPTKLIGNSRKSQKINRPCVCDSVFWYFTISLNVFKIDKLKYNEQCKPQSIWIDFYFHCILYAWCMLKFLEIV